MAGSSSTEPFVGGVAEHHRRTEALLERLDNFCASTFPPPATALLVARLTDRLRDSDRRLLALIARLERPNSEED